ncbi:MAG: hypothetical protein DMD85_10060 [Candidatus Rokuibacteriota bacterium]|nr:MAG: hypothetical protein DMD85_10060 [Candidatus Rokubacteria bacterium]
MEKRILAVLIAAAWAGAAYAQTYQTDRNANAGRPAERSTATQTPGATARAGNPPPPSDGYVGSGAGVVATNPFGLCWRGGAEWSPDKAAAPCDLVPRAAVAPAPIAQAPAPVVAAAPAAPPRVIEKMVLTGHADRIGTEDYNQKLSEDRAQAVADYLATKGVDRSRLQVEAKGETQPITGNQCQKMGPENNKNQKLIACLQPDRRVDAELLGSRETTAGSAPAPAGAGATSGGASSGSAGSSSSNPGAANTK